MQLDGVSALAVLVIGSFAIDRIVSGLMFLLEFIPFGRRFVPEVVGISDDVERSRAERKRKLTYYGMAAIFGGVVLAYFGEVRIFRGLGFVNTNGILDSVMTGLILVAGADKIQAFAKLGGGAVPAVTAPAPEPIEITGRLILEEPAGRSVLSDTKERPAEAAREAGA